MTISIYQDCGCSLHYLPNFFYFTLNVLDHGVCLTQQCSSVQIQKHTQSRSYFGQCWSKWKVLFSTNVSERVFSYAHSHRHINAHTDFPLHIHQTRLRSPLSLAAQRLSTSTQIALWSLARLFSWLAKHPQKKRWAGKRGEENENNLFQARNIAS